MASKHWEAMPANDGPDVDAGAWQCFRKLDSGDEQWLGGTGDKDEMEWTAEYAEGLEALASGLYRALEKIAAKHGPDDYHQNCYEVQTHEIAREAIAAYKAQSRG